MELDKALEFAVILAWDDLMKAVGPCPIRVEYLREPGIRLDYVSVWWSRARGYADLFCDYWTSASPAHPSGIRFRKSYSSDTLAQTLDFIMKNQDQFTRPLDASRHGLILIDAPDGADRTEAAAWLQDASRTVTYLVGGAVDETVTVPPAQMASEAKECWSISG